MDDAPVEIVPPDPRWPALFADERDAIATALAPWLVGVPEQMPDQRRLAGAEKAGDHGHRDFACHDVDPL